MGAVSSLFTRKIALSPTETDPFEGSSALEEEMAAAGRPREIVRQRNIEPSISTDEIRRLSNSLQEVQEFLNRSGMVLDRQRELESELKTCHERLKGFTRDHARQSESNVENISSTNSPTALERKYEQFYDHERMDAVDALEKSRIQKEIRDKWTETCDKYVACLIFEESYTAAMALRNNFLQGISLIMTSAPTIGEQYSEATKKKSKEFHFSISTSKPGSHQGSSIGQISENSLKVIMKETAEICDTDALVQRTLSSLHKYQENGEFQDYTKDFLLKSSLKKYLERCCKYAWKLVCQTPPYIIQGNSHIKLEPYDNVFNSVMHQPSRGSQSPEHSPGYISWVVWPGLFDAAGTRVIRKTEVMLNER